jgi:phosphoribosylformylglycinamidine cyclo-ligase
MDYRQSGVDIDAGNETVRRIKSLARDTFTPAVLSEIGSFGGLFALDPTQHKEPVLVSSADGVGTKLKVAFMVGRHDTIGEDLVNHCVNDILVQGATPLFFLDYLATGRLSPDVAEQVVTGVARGCRENGCALIGGETAEMPGFYADGEYDIAGFIVGVVERQSIVDGRRIAPGDVLIGLASSGLHTNGYSLARRVLFDAAQLAPGDHSPELGQRIGDALLATHRSYGRAVRPLLDAGLIKGMAHITGGGITENLPRILPVSCRAVVSRASWAVPPLFNLIQKLGSVSTPEMFRAFNMGIGLILVCAPSDRDRTLELLMLTGEGSAVVLGEVEAGDRAVRYRP